MAKQTKITIVTFFIFYLWGACQLAWPHALAKYVPPAMINVKLYGAKGDGVTDDSAAIESAASHAAGRTIYFPPGRYLHSQAVRFTSPVQGSGSGTVLVADCPIVLQGNGVSLSNIATTCPVQVQNASNFSIQNCTLTHSTYTALTIGNSSAGYINANTFNGYGNNVGTIVSASSNITINACAYQNENGAVQIFNSTNVNLTNNQLGTAAYPTQDCGIYGYSDFTMTFNNNIFRLIDDRPGISPSNKTNVYLNRCDNVSLNSDQFWSGYWGGYLYQPGPYGITLTNSAFYNQGAGALWTVTAANSSVLLIADAFNQNGLVNTDTSSNNCVLLTTGAPDINPVIYMNNMYFGTANNLQYFVTSTVAGVASFGNAQAQTLLPSIGVQP